MPENLTPQPLILWGEPHSLYAGKVRSYLIKKGLPYREIGATHPRFNEVIVPTIGNLVIPVLETPAGVILQDTTDIINYLELRHPEPAMMPATPLQRVVCLLLDAFGSEGLLPAAMHYRWSYREQQDAFLRNEFGRILVSGPDRQTRQQAGAQLMDYFNSFLPGLGVTTDTIDNLETRYLEFLDALDCHLQRYPYLMGGRPSLADFGLMAPLYGHLARDPVPASIMKNRAPNVYRWTERMNLPGVFDGEFHDIPATFFNDDHIPPSLEAVLTLIFRDWTPELLANAQCYNTWIEQHSDLAAGSLISEDGERRVHPTLGSISYAQGDCHIQRNSSPHTLWHFARVLNEARTLTGIDADRLQALLQQLGGEQMMDIALARPMARENYALVLA